MEIKLCEDCKWCVKGTREIFNTCIFPKQPMEKDYATGVIHRAYKYCSILRKDGWFNDWILGGCCGKKGKYFERKKPTQLHTKETKKE